MATGRTRGRVLITGGGGRLGQLLAQRLLDGGDEPVAFDRVRPALPIKFIEGDLLNAEQLRAACEGIDTVVHLGAATARMRLSPAVTVQTNVVGSVNVLEAAVATGVQRVIVASSDSAVGFTLRFRPMSPQYLPLDEKHPCWPQDPYGLSKFLMEQTCAAYTRAHGLQTVCMRPCAIMYESDLPMWRQMIANPDTMHKSFWVYMDARDAAEAFWLAAGAESLDAHEVLFVAAADALSSLDSAELAQRYYPEVPLPAGWGGERSFVDWSRAKAKIGYEPRYGWRVRLAEQAV